MKFSEEFKKIAKHLDLVQKIEQFGKEVINYLQKMDIRKISREDEALSKVIFKLKAILGAFKRNLTSGEYYNKEKLNEILSIFPLEEKAEDSILNNLIIKANSLTSELLTEK